MEIVEKKILIRQVALPPASLVERSFGRIDYKDAYGCEFHRARPLEVEEVVKAFFSSSPAWVSKLFNLRNRLVRVLGLKVPLVEDPQKQLQEFSAQPGQALGMFKVIDKTAKEILLGEDDKHLDFRISFYLTKGSEADVHRLVLSTTVMIHNRFGRMYFLPVKPLHKLIAKAMLKGVVASLQKKGPQFDTAWIGAGQRSRLS